MEFMGLLVSMKYLLLTLDFTLEMSIEICSSPEFLNLSNNDNWAQQFFMGAVLYTIGCLAIALASIHYYPWSCGNQTYF